jgi:hypothetical protein
MARRKPVATQEEELLELAARRVQIPEGKLWLAYQSDVDLLVIRLKERPCPTRSNSDLEKGVVYNYEGRELVSIEVLDLYGVFTA